MSQCFPKSESKDIWMKDVGKRNGDVEQKKKKKKQETAIINLVMRADWKI